MKYPHVIENGGGEKLTFVELHKEGKTEWLEVSNEVRPGCGPPMHIHFMQDESLTVVKGRMGYQIAGQEAKILEPGETAVFKKGVAHRFWADGDEVLQCTGWVKPANNLQYFLSEIYASTKRNGGKEPDKAEGAYLMRRYRTEFDMPEIPAFVKNVIFPVTIFFGKLAGKYKKYKDAPAPLKG